MWNVAEDLSYDSGAVRAAREEIWNLPSDRVGAGICGDLQKPLREGTPIRRVIGTAWRGAIYNRHGGLLRGDFGNGFGRGGMKILENGSPQRGRPPARPLAWVRDGCEERDCFLSALDGMQNKVRAGPCA
jgi:hypothetical protein